MLAFFSLAQQVRVSATGMDKAALITVGLSFGGVYSVPSAWVERA